MKKILYVTTLSRTINAFLVPHINMLLDKGYKVDCACNIDKPISGELIREKLAARLTDIIVTINKEDLKKC